MRRSSIAAMIWIVVLGMWLAGCASSARSSAATHGPLTPHALVWARVPQAQAVILAQRYLAGMTLDHKIGQMLMEQFISSTYDSESQQIMQQIQPGALVLYKYQMTSLPAAQAMIAGAQHDSPIPMLVSADNEGGFIDNLIYMFPSRPSASDIGYTNNPQFAYDQGKQYAHDMLEVGINTDLAPDVDVQTIDGPDQSTRTFGSTPDQVTRLAGAELAGFQNNGVIGTLKHFPGLGDATTDAHKSLPIIHETRAQIESIDLAPYRALINSNDPPGMIMTTDLLMPAIDDYWPAELSPTIITGILRNELHYDGVVLTDALYMQGLSQPTGAYPGVDQYTAGVLAIKAGCDMLLDGYDLTSSHQMVQTIENAIQSGQLTLARINQSVLRILTLKFERGLLPFAPQSVPGAPQPQFLSLAQMPIDNRG
jgi:beta-N-acetylhexosaminidase